MYSLHRNTLLYPLYITHVRQCTVVPDVSQKHSVVIFTYILHTIFSKTKPLASTVITRRPRIARVGRSSPIQARDV